MKTNDDSSQRALYLKEYTVPGEFKAIFDHNYNFVNNIEKNRWLCTYVKLLADSSKIDFNIVLLDLKNYVLVAQQYYPHYIKRKCKNILFLPFFFINALRLIRIKKINLRKEIILDDWFQNSSEGFYGEELVARLSSNWSTLIANFNSLPEIGLREFVTTSKGFLRSFFFILLNRRKNRIDLLRYTYSFYTKVMKGKTIAKYYEPKLVISGNDNHVSIITAKAAGTDVLLIHNGVRWPYFSEFCFKYADYNISLEAEHVLQTRDGQGCYLKNNYMLGSLRLYNFMSKYGGTDFPLLHDVLWISTYTGLCNYESPLNGYYSAADEQKAIKTFNELVEKNSLKAAYQCRYGDEINDLKRLGLFKEKITYVEVGTKSVYQSIAESNIVLTSWSTACHEAMAFGKRIGFINLSGNKYINSVYKDLSVEYSGGNNCSLEEWFERVNGNRFDYGCYIRQNASYVDELMKIVASAVTKN